MFSVVLSQGRIVLDWMTFEGVGGESVSLLGHRFE